MQWGVISFKGSFEPASVDEHLEAIKIVLRNTGTRWRKRKEKISRNQKSTMSQKQGSESFRKIGCSVKYAGNEDEFKSPMTLTCSVIGGSSAIPGALWKQQQVEVKIVCNYRKLSKDSFFPLQENYCERYYHSEVEFGNGSKVKCRVCVFFPLNTNDVSVEVKQ